METLEQKVKKNAKKAAIGAGLITAGIVFEFGVIDYALYLAGGYMLIPNAKDLGNYVKTTLGGKK